MTIKGFIPLGGYSQNKIKRIYDKSPSLDFGKITGKTIVEKELFNSTGSTGSLTFINNSIQNFINSIGDSVYESNVKNSIRNNLINKYPQLSVYIKNWESTLNSSSFFKVNEEGLKNDSFDNFIIKDVPQTTSSNTINYYFSAAEVIEIRSQYNSVVDNLRSQIKLMFLLKDSSGTIFSKSQNYKKINIYKNPGSESLQILLNDTTSNSKDGFNVNEVISLSFRETFGTIVNDYTCSYNSSNFQAAVNSLFTISSITYTDNKIYNNIINSV